MLGLSRLPLDFVDFHFPSPVDLVKNVLSLREHLTAASLDPNTQIRIGEWTYHPQGAVASSEKSALYMFDMLLEIAKAEQLGNPIVHNHTSLYDQGGWSDGGWTHVGTVSSFNWKRDLGASCDRSSTFTMIGELTAPSARQTLEATTPWEDAHANVLDGAMDRLHLRSIARVLLARRVKRSSKVTGRVHGGRQEGNVPPSPRCTEIPPRSRRRSRLGTRTSSQP